MSTLYMYTVEGVLESVKGMATGIRTKRGALTRELVVETALAKADAEGIEAVSFRRLGAELGVTPMALYRYVANKEELLTAITERVFQEFELPGGDDADWRGQLRELARSFRRVLVGHPAIAAVHVAGLEAGSVNGLRILDVLLGVLRRAGFSAEEGALLSGTLERFVLALVLLETGGQPSRTPAEHEARTREFKARLVTLAPQDVRYVIEAADHLCEPCDPEWAFELALSLLIGGLEQLLQSPRRAAGHPLNDVPGR